MALGFIFQMHYVGTFAITVLDLTKDVSSYRELDVKCYTFANPTRGRLFEDFNIDVAWDRETGEFYVGSSVFV
jgi:hypothetical protein